MVFAVAASVYAGAAARLPGRVLSAANCALTKVNVRGLRTLAHLAGWMSLYLAERHSVMLAPASWCRFSGRSCCWL